MTSSILANEYATDTMALVSRLEGRTMGKVAKSLFAAAEMGTVVIHVPSLIFAEVLYLNEKQRINASILDVRNYLGRFPHIQEFPLSLSVVEAAATISDITELHDRLIAGTAVHLQRELITNDPVIQASRAVKTVW